MITQTVVDATETEQVATGECMRVPVNSIRFVKELYTRSQELNAAIERYRAAIEHLPPIVIARDGILIDGYHRWQAHIKENESEIAAINLGNLADTEIFDESIRRNAGHGQQLSRADKRNLAMKLWFSKAVAYPKDTERIEHLTQLLSVRKSTVYEWTKNARHQELEQQKAKAWDMWLDCHTQQQIADEMGVEQKTISNWISKFSESGNFSNPPESRQHFDIWQFSKSNSDSTYFGQMPPRAPLPTLAHRCLHV